MKFLNYIVRFSMVLIGGCVFSVIAPCAYGEFSLYDKVKMRGAIVLDTEEWKIICSEFEKILSLEYWKEENFAAIEESIDRILERDCDTFVLFVNALNLNLLRELSITQKIDEAKNIQKTEYIFFILIYLQEYIYGVKNNSDFFQRKDGEIFFSFYVWGYYGLHEDNPLFDIWLNGVFGNLFDGKTDRLRRFRIEEFKKTCSVIESSKRSPLTEEEKWARTIAKERWRSWVRHEFSPKKERSFWTMKHIFGIPVGKYSDIGRLRFYPRNSTSSFCGKIFEENINWRVICAEFENLLAIEYWKDENKEKLRDGIKRMLEGAEALKYRISHEKTYERRGNFAIRSREAALRRHAFVFQMFLLALDFNLRGQLSISEKIDNAHFSVKADLLRECVLYAMEEK